ncbi:MAG: 2-amino-4-hydroxy-6-hydroxymethyldihydropteridine diphosphokinase [Balneolaceae bacterium]|nr:MAG: 2-amino-4-hydroxy-6-hydroxymethyldihydropteridine diphosphokinase [Balneolaceae bacterium]
MEKTIIGLGANLGDTALSFRQARAFLAGLSEKPARFSGIYTSEPVGIADREFLNAAALIHTSLPPHELLTSLKEFEKTLGRDMTKARWSNRLIDLDIIVYGDLLYDRDGLKIPHPEYRNRLFVLYPLRDLLPGFTDPETRMPIGELIDAAPKISVSKSTVNW